MPKTCPNCGGAVRVVPNSRVEHYKGLTLMIPGVQVPTCEQCDEQFISPQVADEMQAALEKAHQQALYREFILAMERLKEFRPPAAIARMLGYSLGYFSKLSRRERNLSTPLVAFVKHLAMDPERRLAEFAQMFDRPIKISPSGEIIENPAS